jgi:hypothetical protein
MADIFGGKGDLRIGEDVMRIELSAVNPADVVTRCAGKGCDKTFQGKMPGGWERLVPDARSKLAELDTASERHTVLCPKHAKAAPAA